jgi:hypothetical protein
MNVSTKIYEKMLEENDKKLLITRIREVYLQYQGLTEKDLSLDDERAYFDTLFQKTYKLAEDKVKVKLKYVFIGECKADKSTLIN